MFRRSGATFGAVRSRSSPCPNRSCATPASATRRWPIRRMCVAPRFLTGSTSSTPASSGSRRWPRRCWIPNTGCSCSVHGMRSRTRALTPHGSTARSAYTEPAPPAAICCTTCCRIATRTLCWPRDSTSTSSACSCRMTRTFWQPGFRTRSTCAGRASRCKPRVHRRW